MPETKYVLLPTLTKEDYELLKSNKELKTNLIGFVRKSVDNLTDTERALLHLTETKLIN